MKKEEIPEYGSDDNFFFIVDYTSGGAPYGITWEQAAEGAIALWVKEGTEGFFKDLNINPS